MSQRCVSADTMRRCCFVMQITNKNLQKITKTSLTGPDFDQTRTSWLRKITSSTCLTTMTVLSSNLNAVGTVSDLADHPRPLRYLNNLDFCMITHNTIENDYYFKCS